MDLLKTDALLVRTTVLTTVEQRRTLGPSVSVVIGLLFGLTTFRTAEALHCFDLEIQPNSPDTFCTAAQCDTGHLQNLINLSQ